MTGKNKDEDKPSPERDGDENGEIQPRPFDTKTTIASIISILVTVLLIGAVMGNTGVVKAEEEVVEQHGDMSAQLRPEFENVVYTVDSQVTYKQPWLDSGDWQNVNSDNITDGKLHLNYDEDKPIIQSEDAEINASEELYYEMRTKTNEALSNSHGATLSVNLGDTDSHRPLFSVKVDGGDFLLEYEDVDENLIDLTETIDISEDDFLGEWYRYGVTADTEGNIEATLYHDNYTEIASLSATNGTSVEEGESMNIAPGYESPEDLFDYIYIATEGSAETDQSGAPDEDYESEDLYRPRDQDQKRLEVSAEKIGQGGSNDTGSQEVYGLNQSEVEDPTENRRYFNATEAQHSLAQTGETNDTYDKYSYWQGWSNLKGVVEDELIGYILDEEDITRDKLTIIDYSLDDIELVREFDEDRREEMQKAYADAMLAKAEEENWEIKIDNETDGFETVDALLAKDSFSKLKIDGHWRYGPPDMLQQWKDSLTQHKVQFGSMEMNIGGSTELDYGGLEWSPFTAPVIAAIEAGDYKMDMKEDIKDMTDPMTDISSDMREMSTGMTSLHTKTASDLAETYAGSVDDVSSAWQANQEDMVDAFQATNLEYADTIDSQYNDLSDHLEFSQSGQQELAQSLSEMQEGFTENQEQVFSLLEDGRPTEQPLTVESSNNYSTAWIITIIVIPIVIIASVAMYSRNKGNKGQRARRRR